MNRTRTTFDDLTQRAAAVLLAVGRLEWAEERGEHIMVEAALDLAWDRLAALDRALAAHAEAWRRGETG